MSEEKQDKTSSQTKAGLIEKHKDEVESVEDESPKEKDPRRVPEISKDKAGQDRDKPLH